MIKHYNIAGTSQPGPPGQQLGHYPSLPPGYQNTSVSRGATAPMHPAMQAAAQPYSQATLPYQQVRMKLVRRWLFALSLLIHSLSGCILQLGLYIFILWPFWLFIIADLPSFSLVAWGQLSSALRWLPWVSSPAPQKPWEWSTCYRRGTCCHQARSLPRHPASLRTCRKSTVTQSKLWLLYRLNLL